MSRLLGVLAVFFVLAGCGSVPQKFTMYPTLLQEDKLESDMAIVLVGMKGPDRIDYLQFGHRSLPAINVRFTPQGDSIIAVPLPVGLSDVRLMTITVAGQPAGYIGSTAVGFIGVHTPPVELTKPGLYYMATIDLTKPREFTTVPAPEQLNEFRKKFPSVAAKIQPANFQWPQ